MTQKNIANLNKSRSNIDSHLNKVLQEARLIPGIEIPPSPQSVFYGRISYAAYRVEKFHLGGEGNDKSLKMQGMVVPLLVYIPSSGGPTFPTLIYISPEGKVNQVFRIFSENISQ